MARDHIDQWLLDLLAESWQPQNMMEYTISRVHNISDREARTRVQALITSGAIVSDAHGNYRPAEEV